MKKEKKHGLKVITDGEFRRSYWHLDTFWGFCSAHRETRLMRIVSGSTGEDALLENLVRTFFGKH
ncbi:hypothetical protein FC19_GL002171 [Liquorilactobacillus aquaticus DSM 21051]|uniref:Uncharacterized protein n=1 Tax=Liquorilactobacillus aquaticus DSM 21051 TaxID=1423725 RepID=A0A0R2CUN1_9LACO|nr:hypothetical protein FC19_GL002171 [Liquorilactobacillus aquaticus DSM 21051]